MTEMGIVKALDGINLKLKRGEILGVAGETGSGKTTLALSILRILPPNAEIVSGEIIFDGTNLLSLEEEVMRDFRQKRISLIIQGTSKVLNPLMSVGWQIAEAIEYHEDLQKEEVLGRVKKVLEDTQLGDSWMLSLPDELSVGGRQRVKIALALSTYPDLIVADEPFMGLDPPMQVLMMKFLKTLYDKYKFSMILLSHNLGLLAEFCDSMAIMYAGKILEHSTTEMIFKHPIHPYTKGLVGALPDPRHPKKKRLIYIPGNPPSSINPPEGCRFWPRCPFAKDVCKKIEPMLREINGNLVACHFADQMADISPWELWTEEIAFY